LPSSSAGWWAPGEWPIRTSTRLLP
jgi:hypothetical protein